MHCCTEDTYTTVHLSSFVYIIKTTHSGLKLNMPVCACSKPECARAPLIDGLGHKLSFWFLSNAVVLVRSDTGFAAFPWCVTSDASTVPELRWK